MLTNFTAATARGNHKNQHWPFDIWLFAAWGSSSTPALCDFLTWSKFLLLLLQLLLLVSVLVVVVVPGNSYRDRLTGWDILQMFSIELLWFWPRPYAGIRMEEGLTPTIPSAPFPRNHQPLEPTPTLTLTLRPNLRLAPTLPAAAAAAENVVMMANCK